MDDPLHRLQQRVGIWYKKGWEVIKDVCIWEEIKVLSDKISEYLKVMSCAASKTPHRHKVPGSILEHKRNSENIKC